MNAVRVIIVASESFSDHFNLRLRKGRFFFFIQKMRLCAYVYHKKCFNNT